MAEVAKIVGQLYRVSSNKDGGGRITFDYGAESIEEIHKIIRANSTEGMNFALAIVPYKGQSHQEQVDPDTGEVIL